MAEMTFSAARVACRALGFTLRRTGHGAEMVLYRLGTNEEAPDSYFTHDPADACGTARISAARK